MMLKQARNSVEVRNAITVYHVTLLLIPEQLILVSCKNPLKFSCQDHSMFIDQYNHQNKDLTCQDDYQIILADLKQNTKKN